MNITDKFKDECAVFGIHNHQQAAAITALGLHALQHRGQEACGIVSADKGTFNSYHGLGHVGHNFDSESPYLTSLTGTAAIGHNRYSTTGTSDTSNIQPFIADMPFGKFALAHNGNITNYNTLKDSLIASGVKFKTTSDTEIILHLIANSSKHAPQEKINDALKQLKGAYSLVMLSSDYLIGCRDPHGIRPLVLGKIGNSHILASETCAFDIIGATYIRDIKPGEIVIIDSSYVRSIYPFAPKPSRFCVFEYIYFARPDSIIENRNVYEMRKNIGKQLAKENPIKADIIVPVPDSGVSSAIGYSQESNIPFELGIIRNHYVGRTFIRPTEIGRKTGVKMKHNVNKDVVNGKSIILIDDSIVRGTTSKQIVTMLRQAGAKEIHMFIASPPTKHPCFYGVDTPNRENLMASQMSEKEIADNIGVNTLAFISIDGLYKALGHKGRDNDNPQFCDACFTGDYLE